MSPRLPPNFLGAPGTENDTFNYITYVSGTFSTAAGFENINNNDAPGLDDLAFNGGLTRTHRPLSGSNVIDAGDEDLAVIPFTSTPLTSDQRGAGYWRVIDIVGVHDQGDEVDIGAFEVNLLGTPKIVNVVLKGTGWGTIGGKPVQYSYAEVVAAGDQLRPMFMQGANRIEVHFDVPVVFPTNEEDALAVITDNHQPISATIGWDGASSDSTVGTWSLTSPLGIGKFALMVSGIRNANDNSGLDGDYTNFHGPDENTHTYDDFNDDKFSRLISGDGQPGGIFEFHFSALPGDYNQDGIIVTSGASSDLLTIKDGDGDGTIEPGGSGHDELIVTAHSAGTMLPLRTRTGDYADNDNDMVDAADYLKWRARFGFTNPPLPADGNWNGEIDAADYVIWRDKVGLFSAWKTMSMMPMAAGIPIIDFGNAPKVSNVIVSGSNSTHAPYFFDAHDGSGEQLRTVPVGGVDTISITFSEDVNVSPENLRLVGLYSGNVPTLTEFNYDIGTMTASWRFVEWMFGDQYALVLDDAVTDVEGNRLDGEWKNPATLTTSNSAVSEFPSGDGYAGGDFNFVMTLLPSDFNHDNYVEWTDYGIWSANEMIINTGATHADGDADGDGDVDEDDDYTILMTIYDVYLDELLVLADLDGDYEVDQSDLDVLMDNFGMSNADREDGDLNGDGDVNEFDLDLAFAQFGLALAVVS